jgi:hypothetical protein
MPRPKLFFDTDVCVNVEKGTICRDEWQHVCQHVNDKYGYQISFITLKEIFAGIARSSDEHFERAKVRLHSLCEPYSPQFLPCPAVFAVRTLLELSNVARRVWIANSEEDLYRSISGALLDGMSKDALKSQFSFDLDQFDDHEDQAQSRFALQNEGLRAGKTAEPDRSVMASCILEDLHLSSNPDSCQKLVIGLDAACTFTEVLCRQSKNPQFSFQKHRNNWGDMMQLYYLCDESMHFVTSDTRIRPKVSGSSQESRILLYDDLVKSF